MKEEGISPDVVQAIFSEKGDAFSIKPTTGLTEGQPSKNIDPVLKQPSFIRRALGIITGKFKAPEDSWGKGF